MNKVNTRRKTNIEILRIVAMLMIIGSHYVAHGIQNSINSSDAYIIWTNGSNINKLISAFFLPGGPVGVAIFFIITGYFQSDGRKHSLNIIYSSVLFYGILSTIAFCLFKIMHIPIPNLTMKMSFSFVIKSLLIPLTGGAWWFITAYVFLILASTEINNFLCKLNDKGWILLLLLSCTLWYGLASFDAPFFQFQKAVFFYVMGAFCRRYPLSCSKLLKTKLFLIFTLFWIIASIGYFLICENQIRNNLEYEIVAKLIELIVVMIAVPTCSYAAFNFFVMIDLGCKKYINDIGKASLGIYLFHDSAIFRPIIWNVIFKVDSMQFQQNFFIIYALGTITIVFMLSLIIELFRERFVASLILTLYKKATDCFKIYLIRSDENEE